MKKMCKPGFGGRGLAILLCVLLLVGAMPVFGVLAETADSTGSLKVVLKTDIAGKLPEKAVIKFTLYQIGVAAPETAAGWKINDDLSGYKIIEASTSEELGNSVAWSAQNRSPLIRIPAARGSGTRIELRNPDPCANPYLVLAVCLAAGLDGMERKLTPPPEVHSNIFKMTEEELEELGIERIPYSLKNAIRELRKDELIKATLGDHILTKYIRHKNHEWDAYSMSVSSWEIDNYLAKY